VEGLLPMNRSAMLKTEIYFYVTTLAAKLV